MYTIYHAYNPFDGMHYYASVICNGTQINGAPVRISPHDDLLIKSRIATCLLVIKIMDSMYEQRNFVYTSLQSKVHVSTTKTTALTDLKSIINAVTRIINNQDDPLDSNNSRRLSMSMCAALIALKKLSPGKDSPFYANYTSKIDFLTWFYIEISKELSPLDVFKYIKEHSSIMEQKYKQLSFDF